MSTTVRNGLLVAAFAIQGLNGCARVRAQPPNDPTGRWEVVNYVRGDRAKPVLPDEDVQGTVQIRDGMFRFTISSGGREEARLLAKIYLDPAEGAIDLVETDEPDKGGMTSGIYELNGDEMRICLPTAEPFLERPTVISAEPGSHRELLILRRMNQ
jgi:uncharacterized protein (TIGR03067 family)